MKLSARNVLKGKVKKVTQGTVNAEVVIEVQGPVQLVAMITRESASNLALAPGKDAYAIVKASSVMVGTDS